jgi:glycine cleavage system H protein
MMSNIPDGLLYTKEDEWINVDGDMATIGLTDYAQDALSDIVYIELPDVGERYETGETFGVVESVKAASDIYMPVGGEIIAVNEELLDSPETVNTDPYNEGWLLKIRLDDPGDLEELLDPSAYSDYCDERG